MRRGHKVWASALALSFLVIVFLAFQFSGFAVADADTHELAPMTLTIISANGTQVVLDENDIAALPSCRAYGGFKTQLNIVKGLGNYTGVSLNTLCDLVGGLTSASIINVSASEYWSTFTFDEAVNGNFTTYNPTGNPTPHTQPLTPIVAYHFNDMNINESNGGPLRLAIVGPEGLITDSTYWVKWVTRIEITESTVPEFPSIIILSLLLLATSAATIIIRAATPKQPKGKRFRRL